MKNPAPPHSAANHLSLFFQTKWQILVRRFFTGWSDRKRAFERSTTLFILLGLVIGGYSLFHFVFGYFLGLEQVGRILLERIFQLGWNTIFLLLVISNIITAFSTLYRSDEVKYMLTNPVSFRALFHIKFVDNLVYSSWALALLGTPILTAYMHQLHITWLWWIPLILVSLFSFLTIAGVVALLILLVLLRVAEYTSIKIAFGGLLALVVGGFMGYFFLYNPPSLVVRGPASFNTLNQYLLKLGNQPFPFTPTYWLKEVIAAFANGNWSRSALFGGTLIFTGLAGWFVLLDVAQRWWYRTWQVLSAGDKRKRLRYDPQEASPVRWYWKFLPSQLRGLFIKDVLQFVRLPNQWVQFLLMFVFLLIYLGNLFNVAVRFNLQNPFWQTLIFFINFGFSGFIIASMIARYIYPLISLEGPGFWFLRSAPLSIRTLFRQKFILSIGVFLVIAEMIVLVSNYVLRVSFPLMLLSAGTLIVMSVALSAIAIGLGARFPEFNETNPMKIASTAGGFITVILCLIYVAVVTLVMAIPTYQYFQYLSEGAAFPSLEITVAAVLLILINIFAIWYPLRIGERHLAAIEV